ncbi:MAG: cytochrome C oxidase subunit IV family protein [Polyangiaceae bacterium]|nr:cytochrome C oxidase subunit IV family protein [Polyangiaceae bacterium]
MSEPATPAHAAPLEHPRYGTFVAVWAVLVALTGLLVLLSHFGQRPALWSLLTISPFKAGLVFYYFMHLRYEGPLIKSILLIALATLLIFLTLLFADIAFA